MTAEQQPEGFGFGDAVACRQRVHGVLHRVGRQHVAIVAVRIGCVVGAFEADGHRQIAQIVTVAAARHLDEADAGLSVRRLRQRRLSGDRGHRGLRWQQGMSLPTWPILRQRA